MKCSGKNCPMQYPYDEKACAILETCPYATLIPYTNADRIRAMSDEELAWELMVWRCEAVSKHHGVESKYPDTQQTILKWLQQSTEEDT